MATTTSARCSGRATTGSILDFEGEPARSLAERRRKRSPLRDVAGMLRSFAYAASAADLAGGARAPDGWETRAREEFLGGYFETVDRTSSPGQAAVDRLLSLFELEKAVYELRYELNHRPDWLGIPVAGILRLLEESDGGHRRCTTPHATLGAHPSNGGVVVRAFRPAPSRSSPGRRGTTRSSSSRPRARAVRGLSDDAGCRSATSSRCATRTATPSRSDDPYAFAPTLGELDLHLVGEGRHEELCERLGAHVREVDGVDRHRLRGVGAERRGGQRGRRLQPLGRARSTRCGRSGATGIWELFVPERRRRAQRYKFEVRRADGSRRAQGRPVRAGDRGAAGHASRRPPLDARLARRGVAGERHDAAEPLHATPMSIYEVHLGSWRRNPREGNRSLTYRELADELADYVDRPRLHPRRAAAGDGAPVHAARGATR